MRRVRGRFVGLAILVFGFSAAAASAQDQPGAAPVGTRARWSVEGAAGSISADGSIQGSGGSLQAVAVGFAPMRSLTVLVSAERSHIPARIERYEHWYSTDRGGRTQFISAEVRYAFFMNTRASPYVLGGIGFGNTRQTVNELFSNDVKRGIKVDYLGAGVRIPVRRWLDAFADARFMITANDQAEMGVYAPLRGGVACRF